MTEPLADRMRAEARAIRRAYPDTTLPLVEWTGLILKHADEVEALAKALRPVVEALGDHYCGVCGNGGDEGIDQPYSSVTDPDTQTCSGCRHNHDAYRAGRAALSPTETGGES